MVAAIQPHGELLHSHPHFHILLTCGEFTLEGEFLEVPELVTKTGQGIYKAEKHACRAFPDPQNDGLASGPTRNFQILASLELLAEFTQHIPPQGAHLIRYYGWYSNKARGMRQKAAAEAAAAESLAASSSGEAARVPAPSRSSQTWAMLIKRVYELDPLACPRCGGQMKVIAFIEPPQAELIEKILRHCGLWHASSPRGPPVGDGWVHDPDGDSDSQTDASAAVRGLTFVDMDTFDATF